MKIQLSQVSSRAEVLFQMKRDELMLAYVDGRGVNDENVQVKDPILTNMDLYVDV